MRILKMLDLNFAKAANRCRCQEKSLYEGHCDPGGLEHPSPRSVHTHLFHHGMQSYRRKVVFPEHHVQDLAVP